MTEKQKAAIIEEIARKWQMIDQELFPTAPIWDDLHPQMRTDRCKDVALYMRNVRRKIVA